MNPKASFGNISQQAAGYCTPLMLDIPMCFAHGIISIEFGYWIIRLKNFNALCFWSFSLITSSKFQRASLLKLGTH